MRADYATSDLISKVNSDWINEVLLNSELGQAGHDDGNDDGDLMQRRRWGEPAWPSMKSTEADDPEPDFADELIDHRPRRRSVARRVTERLALAITALAIVGLGIRMSPEPQDVRNSVPVRTTNASAEAAADINTASVRPAWLSPEILYGPAMARSPLSVPKPGR
jgi:hypothetical protein